MSRKPASTRANQAGSASASALLLPLVVESGLSLGAVQGVLKHRKTKPAAPNFKLLSQHLELLPQQAAFRDCQLAALEQGINHSASLCRQARSSVALGQRACCRVRPPHARPLYHSGYLGFRGRGVRTSPGQVIIG